MLKLLPIGTVVRLKGASIPFMIAGYFPEDESKPVFTLIIRDFPIPLGFSSDIEASFSMRRISNGFWLWDIRMRSRWSM